MTQVLRCDRCQRRWRGANDWNVVMDSGRQIGALCPACQTPVENAEAVMNESTIDYGRARVTDDGRLWAPIKSTD